MVKKISSIITLCLLVAALVFYPWPTDKTGIIYTIALTVFALAAGMAIANLMEGAARGGKK